MTSFSDKGPPSVGMVNVRGPLDDVRAMTRRDVDEIVARHDGDRLAAAGEIAEAARRQLASIRLRVDTRGVRVDRVTTGKPPAPPANAKPFLSPSEYSEADVQDVIAAARDGEEVAGGVLRAVGSMRDEMARPARELALLDVMRHRTAWRTFERLGVDDELAARCLAAWSDAGRVPTEDEIVAWVDWQRERARRGGR